MYFKQNILIIKHGALGDWILATGAFRVIRQHYPKAEITLLTNSRYVEIAKAISLFDEICIDNREGVLRTLKLISQLRKKQYSHVFDLQQSNRTRAYRWFLKSKFMDWKGVKKNHNKKLNQHVVERLACMLKDQGIVAFPKPYATWLKADICHLQLHHPYALVIPGCSKHRTEKRWSVSGYVEVIRWLESKGIKSLIIGTEMDFDIIEPILDEAKTHRLSPIFYKASLFEVAQLARAANVIIGSDTGPMHIAALEGKVSVVFFCNKESHPSVSKPFSDGVRIVCSNPLQTVRAEQVIHQISEAMQGFSFNNTVQE